MYAWMLKAFAALPTGREDTRVRVDVEKRSWLPPRRGEGTHVYVVEKRLGLSLLERGDACACMDMKAFRAPTTGVQESIRVCIREAFTALPTKGGCMCICECKKAFVAPPAWGEEMHVCVLM